MKHLFPTRHGKPWNEDEVKFLAAKLNKGWTIVDIARRLQRTEYAIECAIKNRIKNTDSNFEYQVERNEGRKTDISGLVIDGNDYDALLKLAATIVNSKIEILSKLGVLK